MGIYTLFIIVQSTWTIRFEIRIWWWWMAGNIEPSSTWCMWAPWTRWEQKWHLLIEFVSNLRASKSKEMLWDGWPILVNQINGRKCAKCRTESGRKYRLTGENTGPGAAARCGWEPQLACHCRYSANKFERQCCGCKYPVDRYVVREGTIVIYCRFDCEVAVKLESG